jgi:signal peptidase I
MSIKQFWHFLKEDTWQSWLVSLVLIIIFIKLIFFPALTFFTGSSLPLVVVESCSLYHESDFDDWWGKNSAYYESKEINKSQFMNFQNKNGLNKGDIIFVTKPSQYNLGDIIIFQPNPESTAPYPIIHRIITLDPRGTKGDHNSDQLKSGNNANRIDETNIPDDRIIGKASVRLIPYLGWIKLIFFEPLKPADQRGLCK